MDFFFVEYRDPLVGLIILTILVFVVAVANYIWKIFANKDEEQKLEKFIKKFEMDNAHKELLRNSSLSFGNLSFLAEIFTKSGEFEKATQIYLIALEKCKDKQESAIVCSIFVGFFMNKKQIYKIFSKFISRKIFLIWLFFIRFISPIAIILVMCYQIFV